MRYSVFNNKDGYQKFALAIIISLFCCSQSVLAQFDIPPIPEKETSVYDYVNLLSARENANLETKLIRYSDSTSTQIVVAIIATTKGENIGLLTPKWAHEWGIGQAKEDNGVFILLARDDRKIWISPGYGVEDRLTAGITGELIRNEIIPEFKKGDYYQGLNKGSDAIFEVLTGAYQGTRKANSTDFPFLVFFLLFVVFIIFIIAISKNRRGGGKNGKGGRNSFGTDILDAIILSNMGRGSYSGSSGGFGGSSSGGSFGGGGFGGGFGGGGFSGGGAGGSW